MRRAAGLVICVMLVTHARRDLAAQTDVSIGAGAGTVRASDGPSFAALTLAPGLRRTTAASFVALQGTLAALPSHEWNAQLNADAWTRVAGGRAGGIAIVSGFAANALPSAARAGSAQLAAEGFRGRGPQGVALGAGVVFGAAVGTRAVGAPRAHARAWRQTDAAQYTLAIQATGLRGAWFTDVTASATLDRSRLQATVSATGRVSSDWRWRGTGALFAAWRLADRVALEASVSGFLSDPFLGYPRAWTAGAGVRVHWGARPPRLLQPVLARRHGDSVLVRVRFAGAVSVALAGEWNGWTPLALRRIGADRWEGSLSLAPGTYRFSLVVDGSRWLVPPGVAAVSDDLGGTTGLLVVPPVSGQTRP